MSDSAASTSDPPSIEARELYEKIVAGDPAFVLDLRNRDEVQTWTIDGPRVEVVQTPAVRFVQANVQGNVGEVADDLGVESPVIVVCGEGRASAKVATILTEAGIEAANLEGGMEAWGRLVVANEVPAGDGTVTQYLRPATGCVSYLVTDGEEAAVVDPLRAAVDRYVADATDRDYEIEYAIDTHVHADHVSGVRDVAERTGANRMLPDGARDRGLGYEAEFVADGDVVHVGEATIEAIHAPGHTTEMTAFRVGDVLLSGDSLFLSSVARPDLESDQDARDLAETLYDTLHDRLLELPAETRVAPGHVSPSEIPEDGGGYVASLADLREQIHLLGLDREAFVERILENLPPRPANHETIVDVNLGRQAIGEEDGFELELGPNSCAVSP